MGASVTPPTQRPRAVVTRRVYPDAIEILSEAAEVVACPEDRDRLADEDLRRALGQARALVCQLTDPIGPELMDLAPDLRIIANVAVGYDNIDVAAASARSIVVTNTPGVLTEATADLTLALILTQARRMVEADRFIRDGQWGEWAIDLLCGRDLAGSTLGIVGFGRIGRAVARRARAFGMNIVYWNRSPVEGEDGELGRQVSLDELLATSDTVSLHIAMTPETRHLIGEGEIELMRSDAVLVNTARGGVVDEAALVDALQRGRIAGAALDVFDREPHVPEALLAMPQVVVAPHLGSATVGTRRRMCAIAARNAVAVLRGEIPPHPVNPDVLGPPSS